MNRQNGCTCIWVELQLAMGTFFNSFDYFIQSVHQIISFPLYFHLIQFFTCLFYVVFFFFCFYELFSIAFYRMLFAQPMNNSKHTHANTHAVDIKCFRIAWTVNSCWSGKYTTFSKHTLFAFLLCVLIIEKISRENCEKWEEYISFTVCMPFFLAKKWRHVTRYSVTFFPAYPNVKWCD